MAQSNTLLYISLWRWINPRFAAGFWSKEALSPGTKLLGYILIVFLRWTSGSNVFKIKRCTDRSLAHVHVWTAAFQFLDRKALLWFARHWEIKKKKTTGVQICSCWTVKVNGKKIQSHSRHKGFSRKLYEFHFSLLLSIIWSLGCTVESGECSCFTAGGSLVQALTHSLFHVPSFL